MAYPFQKNRKHLCVNSLITTISESYEQIPDVRPNKDPRKITIHDASMSAFAMMHLKYPSLLSFERDKTEQEVRHNLEHLYQIKKRAPCDTSMREILDPIDPAEFKKPFKTLLSNIQRGGLLKAFEFHCGNLKNHYLLPIDGTGLFYSCNNKTPCQECCTKNKGKANEAHYHQLMAACILTRIKKQSYHWLLRLWVRCLGMLSRKIMAFDRRSPFAEFNQILIQDGSSQAVHQALQNALPGRFSKVSPAAVELHAMIDLLNDNFFRVQLTEDTRSERACLPSLPSSLALCPILIDAGYFERDYFAAVDDREGSFICRAPQSINPIICTAIREDGKYLNRYQGKKLKDILSQLPKDLCVDFDGVWPQDKSQVFRLVIRWNGEKKKWVFIVTNLDRSEFTLCEVLQAYRLRWQIELLFKEVKSYSGWHRFNTRSATLVASLILLSFIVATLRRYLAHAAEAGMTDEISTQKAAKSGKSLF